MHLIQLLCIFCFGTAQVDMLRLRARKKQAMEDLRVMKSQSENDAKVSGLVYKQTLVFPKYFTWNFAPCTVMRSLMLIIVI